MPDPRNDLPPEIRDREDAIADGLLDEFEALEEAGGARFQTPDTVAEAIGEGMPALKAFRQSEGLASHDAAVEAGIDPGRMAVLENGAADATPAEMDALSHVLRVPKDRLT